MLRRHYRYPIAFVGLERVSLCTFSYHSPQSFGVSSGGGGVAKGVVALGSTFSDGSLEHDDILTRFTPKGFDKLEIEMAFGESDNMSFCSKVVPILVISLLRACTRLPLWRGLCFGILTKAMQC